MAKPLFHFVTGILLAFYLVLLGGCANTGLTPGQIASGINIATTSIDNPITPTREVQIEAAIDAGFVVLNTYRTLCLQKKVDKNCRANIVAMQKYTRPMRPIIVKLRSFVDNNQQINAIAAYKQLADLYEPFKQIASSLGYNIGALP